MKSKADKPVVADQQETEEQLPENVRVFMLTNKGGFWGLDLVEDWVISGGKGLTGETLK